MKKLTWESSFFKQSCGELNDFREGFDANKTFSFDWVQSRVPIDARENIHYLESHGFLFEDLKITFDKTLNEDIVPSDNNKILIREGVKSDIKQVQQIAKSVLPDKSRFVSVVGKNKTADFYSEWSEKAINHEFDDVCYVVVPPDSSQIAGFMTLKFLNGTTAQIGLLAISLNFQKLSLASMMLSYCEHLLARKGIKNLIVSTEGKNIAAQRFYIKNKFNVKEIECWFYRK